MYMEKLVEAGKWTIRGGVWEWNGRRGTNLFTIVTWPETGVGAGDALTTAAAATAMDPMNWKKCILSCIKENQLARK